MPHKTPTPIHYVEFTSPELETTQAFFAEAFGWEFVSYGDDYKDIKQASVEGGLERGALRAPLVILKSDDLESTLEAVRAAGASITQEIFEFPGGRRFQFREPGGNEMAVWSPEET